MNKGKYPLAGRRDLIIVAALLVISLVSVPAVRFLSKSGSTAVIQCGDVTTNVSLDESGEFTLECSGDTLYEINDGKIRIKDAPCNDKICVNTGFIGNCGESIICIPQKLIITIEGESDESVPDAVTG